MREKKKNYGFPSNRSMSRTAFSTALSVEPRPGEDDRAAPLLDAAAALAALAPAPAPEEEGMRGSSPSEGEMLMRERE